MAPLVASQLSSKDAPQVDERTNTIFFRETRSNIDNIRKMLVQIDKPTKQVMIEARLVEVNANPKQSYGINWAGVVGSSTKAQDLYVTAGTNDYSTDRHEHRRDDSAHRFSCSGQPRLTRNFFGNLGNLIRRPIRDSFRSANVGDAALLNEDSDAEFLANPRVVTADNQQAKIEIIRNQPVPQLNFNEQTATAVFGGFQDKKFGNTLVVRPSVNKDNFITLT